MTSNPFLVASGLHRQSGFVLRQASTAIWADLVVTLEPFGLKPQSYATLLIVAANPGCKQQDVADALAIQRPNMVALIDRLVASDWIARSVNAEDRRSYALTLTAAGATLLDASRVAHRAHEERVTALLGASALNALLASCEKLARIAR